jgi:hypothetical protein
MVVDLISQMQARYSLLQKSEADAGEDLIIAEQPTLENEVPTHYRLQLTFAGAVMGILLAVARWISPSERPCIAELR